MKTQEQIEAKYKRLMNQMVMDSPIEDLPMYQTSLKALLWVLSDAQDEDDALPEEEKGMKEEQVVKNDKD